MSEFSPDWPHGWQTRDGSTRMLRIIGKKSNGKLVFEGDDGNCWVRNENGSYNNNNTAPYFLDIINSPAPKPEPRKWWVNVIRGAEWPRFNTFQYREDADSCATSDRIACVCITEGDGLEDEQ